ncbi:hypothetical protein O181_001453 [Austropuccinia psidii MF-1]|uniref:Uncharacterized protein n=1 Tax=Austropuccinia psidii MF-1 TaxID=1389203 RepID=A0A9Q3GBQ7_9BASI|nr:hypothetical protein [Austropuccinia psidii MF-1]
MICMAGDELYEFLPLVHKENVNGHHHPYASKPRTAHAISSREKWWMMNMRTCLSIRGKQMKIQGGTISWGMRRALNQIVSSPTQSMLEQSRPDSKGTRLTKLTMWQNVQARRRNKDG